MIAATDLRRPENLKRMAALPFYGQALVLIRRLDPYWKIETPCMWTVHMEGGYEKDECPTCGCKRIEDAQRQGDMFVGEAA